MTHSISAFYQCYKQPKALLRTLSSFKQFYSQSEIELISDGGGYNYVAIADHFNIHYRQLSKRTGEVANSTVFSRRQDIIEWIARLVEAAKNTKGEYLLLLEDDVVVLKKIESQLPYDINGANKKEFLGEKMEEYLLRMGKNAPTKKNRFFYGGCGGSIFKASFLVKNFSDHKLIESIIVELEPYREGRHLEIYSTDYWISLLTYYVGGTIGRYNGFCEKWERVYWWRKYIMKNIEVVHQDKTFYNKPLLKREKQLLGEFLK